MQAVCGLVVVLGKETPETISRMQRTADETPAPETPPWQARGQGWSVTRHHPNGA